MFELPWLEFPTIDQRFLNLMYSKNRFYHDSQHTALVYRYAIELSGENISHSIQSYLKILAAYHDVVYDMTSTTNEIDSANKMRESNIVAGYSQVVIDNLASIIEATADHWNPENNSLPIYGKIFLDADLYELAAPWEVFNENSNNIFKEYMKHFDVDRYNWPAYNQKRLEFFKNVLAKPKIYWVAEHLEEKARSNLKRALA